MAEKENVLSDREQEVLQCVLEGAGNKEIAAALTISENTVKVHLRNIYAKLDVNSRTEATTVALQQGWVTLAGVTVENSSAEIEPETVAEQAVSSPPSDQNQTVDPAPLPRSTFFPRRIAFASLLFILLIAVIILSFQAFSQTEQPTGTPAVATVEPFTETAISEDWLQTLPLPAARTNMAFVGSGLNLYLIGGETNARVTNNVFILDTSVQVWREGTAKPTAVTDITGAELFGEIYIPGGKLANGQPTNIVEVYSPANDTWRVTAPLPTAVSGGLVLSDGSFIYLFGGWGGQSVLNSVYRFDPAASSWQILPNMPTARAFASGGLVKGKLYVVGGYDGERPLSECAYFDPSINIDDDAEIEGRWENCADTLLPRAGASATALLNKLYLFGGGAFSEEAIPYSESYNPDVDQWSVVNTPPLNDLPGWSHLGITNIEINIYAVGGIRGSKPSADTFIYRPLTYQTYIPIAPVDNSNR